MPWQRGDQVRVVRAVTWGLRRGMTGRYLFTDSQGTVHVRWDADLNVDGVHYQFFDLGADPAAGDEVELISSPETTREPHARTLDPGPDRRRQARLAQNPP